MPTGPPTSSLEGRNTAFAQIVSQICTLEPELCVHGRGPLQSQRCLQRAWENTALRLPAPPGAGGLMGGSECAEFPVLSDALWSVLGGSVKCRVWAAVWGQAVHPAPGEAEPGGSSTQGREGFLDSWPHVSTCVPTVLASSMERQGLQEG